MTAADLCAGAMLVGLLAYAVLGGADFGGGVWDLLASGPRKERQREAIARAMGPVWEANHVWLIFVIVVFFSAFPEAWAVFATAMFTPLRLALIGIALRGVSFVFRAYAPHHGRTTSAAEVRFGAVFGAASLCTPFVLGTAVAAVSAGNLRVDAPAQTPWFTPLAFVMGAAAVSLCAYLAAVFLCVETEGELRADFRRRALISGGVVVAGATTTLPLLRTAAPQLWSGLLGRGAPLLAVGGVAALVALFGLLTHRYALTRAATIAQVSAIVLGFGAAQYPYLLYPAFTVAGAAAPAATLKFFLWSLPFGLLIIVPSLVFLFRVFKTAPRSPSE